MELIPMEVCMLCDQNTAVLSSNSLAPYVKYMNSTFFDKDTVALECFQEATVDKKFCTLCAHKIVVSHKLKDIYEEISKNHTTSFKKSRMACLLCESKSSDLIQTDSNPNEFDIKIKSFMNSTLYPRPYLQCAICFDCLFYLSIWFEMNKHVMEKINGKKQSQASIKRSKRIKSSHTGSSNTADDVILIKDKENITPENNNHSRLTRSHRESNSTTPQKRKRNSYTVIDSDCEINLEQSINSSSTVKSHKITPQKSKKFEFSLRHLKSIKGSKNNIKWPRNIVKDKKMFESIPYVLMAKSNKKESVPMKLNKSKSKTVSKRRVIEKFNTPPIARKSSRLNKEIQVIVLSDTESEVGKVNKNIKKVTPRPVKKIRIKPQGRPKSKIKVKMFSSPISNSPYACNVCDQVFKVNCEFKAHCLWHEKPEDVIVNVTREDLSKQLNTSEDASQNPPEENNKPQEVESNIDSLIKKYVDVVEDSDCSSSNDIDNIIKNLNSDEEGETVKKDDETGKSKNEDNVEQENSDSSTKDPKVDADEKQASNSEEQCQIESEKEVQNESQKNENLEIIPDMESNSVTDKEKEIEDVTKENNTEDDKTKPEQPESLNSIKESEDIDKEEEQREDEEEEHGEKNENLTEINIESSDSDTETENIIEKNLAKLHGEEEESLQDEEEINMEKEEEKPEESTENTASENENYESVNTNGDTNNEHKRLNITNSDSESEQVENGAEDQTNSPTVAKENLKRKRVTSLVIFDNKPEENSSDTETVTPKPKKVRFAMDYDNPASPSDDHASEAIQEDSINKTEDLSQDKTVDNSE